MQTWACGHEGEKGHSRLCPHLVNVGDADYARVLRGEGMKSDLCCSDCATLTKKGEGIEWLAICEACVELHDDNGYCLIEWIGQPEIKERLTPFDMTLVETVLSIDAAWAIAIAPLDARHWVGFWHKRLFLVDEVGATPVCTMPKEASVLRIYLSPDGRFAAVCHDYGRYGFVVDLEEKRVTMTLDKKESYASERIPFPAAFFLHQGRNLLVHATNWNQLDISDPTNGTLISTIDDQGLYSKRCGHGQLLVSPNFQWIADDQWQGRGSGSIVAWNLMQWVQANTQGAGGKVTSHFLCSRNYLWNIPIAWVDNERVAIWGIGPDEDLILNGARIFDIGSGKETTAFVGPSQKAFFGGEGRLFSVEADGLHIWDASTGERLGRINGFTPQWQRGDLLIELNASRLTGGRVKSWNWRTAFA